MKARHSLIGIICPQKPILYLALFTSKSTPANFGALGVGTRPPNGGMGGARGTKWGHSRFLLDVYAPHEARLPSELFGPKSRDLRLTTIMGNRSRLIAALIYMYYVYYDSHYKNHKH